MKSNRKLRNFVLVALSVIFALGAIIAVFHPHDRKTYAIDDEKKIELSFPGDDQAVSVLKPAVMDYITAMKEQSKNIQNDYIINNLAGDTVKIADYYRKNYNDGKSKNVALVFDAKNFEDNTTFTVKVADNDKFNNATSIETKESYATINNLYINKKYYWKVEADGVSSEIGSFVTEDYVRMLTVESSGYKVANVRDFGGRVVEDGRRIKQGIIFRGGELVSETYTSNGTHSKTIDDTIISYMKNEMGIAYEIDLRGESEANNITASELGDGVSYLRVTNGAGGGYAGLWNHTNSNISADSLNGNVKNKELLRKMFVEGFTNANEKHVYFHCWGGADRTGTVGFLLGALLGMSYTDLIMDYEFTSFAKNYRPHDINDPNNVYTFPKFIDAIKSSSYYRDGKKLSEIVKDWMIGALDMTEEQVETLKNNLLE